MTKPTGLPYRTRKALFALVTEYIASGEAVGSRTLARKYMTDLSPATIRNMLADLEDAGFLYQPHTSAGRMPTERGLRAFVETLTELEEIPEAQASEMSRKIRAIVESEMPGEGTLRRTGALLSELSGAAAVVTSAPIDVRTLSQLRFIVTRPHQLLAVLVFSDGSVENRFVPLESRVTDSELERVHNLLADVVEGRTLCSLRDLFRSRVDDERMRVDGIRRRAYDLGSRAVAQIPESARVEVVIEGRPRLFELPEYDDVVRLRQLARALEEREQLVTLLERTLEAGAVSVYIGNESSDTAELGAANLSLVVAPFGDADSTTGAVGVLGPTRMDYGRMMTLVEATASALTLAMRKAR
ncbi:MAG: heat-inducible transcription repressor HrcA [Myxococcales bacterium]|nr:heat-inducible transcription repressor HrcA [Myxococcales bacterium]